MLYLWPKDAVVDGNRPKDPDNDGNALAGPWRAVRREVGVILAAFIAYVVCWVAFALLLHRLAS